MPHVLPAASLESPPLTFDGGFSYLDQSRVKANQLTSGRNWWQDEDGVVRPRPGNKVWNAAALGAEFQGLWEYRRASDQVNRLIAYAGGSLFKGDDTTKSFTLLLSGLNTGARGSLIQAQDLFWWCNGKDVPRSSDASTIVRIGIVAPSAAPTVALVALAGVLPLEAHNYRYAYVREEGGIKVRESNPSAESATVTPVAGSQQIDVTVTVSADTQVTHIYIYRKSATTVPEAKFVAKVTNTTQTYRDNIAVGSLGGFAFWETSGGLEDHGTPPVDLFALTNHRDGRMYAWSTKSRLLYTRVNTFHYWPGASGGVSGAVPNGIRLIINEDDGDEGQATLSEGDDLWLLKRYHVYRLLGDGPTQDDGLVGSWRVEQVPTTLGCAARASAAVGPAGAFWLSDAGPVQVEPRSGLPRLIGEGLLPWLKTTTDLTKAHGWVWKWYYFLFIPISGGKWEGHGFDVRNRTWWPLKDMHALAFASRETGTLVWGGILEVDKPANGVVYEWDQQVSDNGQPVTAELTSRVIDVRPRAWKLLREVILACEGRPGSTFTARLIPDQSPSYIERQLKLSGLTGVRMLKPFPGTKQLQGWTFQLYLKSANLTARPAIYYWQQLIHTLNREALYAPPFAAIYPDPDPTVGIVDGNFIGGSHTNTRVAAGKVVLADEYTWTLAFDLPQSGPTFMLRSWPAGDKLVGYAFDSVNTRLVAVYYDGTSWQTAPITANNEYTQPGSEDFYEVSKAKLLILGNTLFIVVGDRFFNGVKTRKVYKSTDLSTWTQHSSLIGAVGDSYTAIGLYGGIIHVGGIFGTAGPRLDDGLWSAVGPAELAVVIVEFQGVLHVYAFNTLRALVAGVWTTKYTNVDAHYGTASVVFSKNGKLYWTTSKSLTRTGKVLEWDGTTGVVRVDSGAFTLAAMDVTEVTVDEVPTLFAAVGEQLFTSEDGTTWTNRGTVLAGQHVFSLATYKGKRYAALQNGDIYRSNYYKLTGTYRSAESDLGTTKTSAQVRLTATVPAAATLQSRLGYSSTPGGPYIFTAQQTATSYQVPINGRYLVYELSFTGDGATSAAVDEVEILAR